MKRKYLNLPERGHALPFSDAVLCGDTLYISGRIGFEPGSTRLPTSPEQEARNLLQQFSAVLALAGMGMEDLVYMQIYCPDLSLFDCFNSVYREFFHSDFPARAFLGSGPLLFNARFEMLGTAVRRG